MRCRSIVVFARFFLLFVCLAGTLEAQNNAAILDVNGSVTLNGAQIGSSTSIFVGDRLEIPRSSAASINRSGSSVVVRPNSSIRYEQSNIEITSGAARISTSDGMSARMGQITISPTSGVAKFDVGRVDNVLFVASRGGDLTLNNSGRITTLESGATTTLTLSSAAGYASPRDGGSPEAAAALKGLNLTPPFYDAGMVSDPSSLPICTNTKLCLGPPPNVGPVRPCKCKP